VGQQARGRGELPTQRPKASKFSKHFPPDLNPRGRVGREWGYQVGNALLVTTYFIAYALLCPISLKDIV